MLGAKIYSERRQLAINDYNKYGDYQEGTYNGISWNARRCYDSSPIIRKDSPENANSFHWCGYVILGDKYKKEHKDYMCQSGKECTYKRNGTIGFDCAHHGDYPTDTSSTGIYKDFPYVLQIIEKTIDMINACV